MLDENVFRLLQLAQKAAKRAYNPYSHFSVGCALQSVQGQVYSGANIESAAYSATICAERVAAGQAVFANDRVWDLMVVVSPQQVSPCGVCRQFLYEFSPDLQVYMGYLEGTNLIGPVSLRDLLPFGMTLETKPSTVNKPFEPSTDRPSRQPTDRE